MRILVVEDEPGLNEIIVKKLAQERYSVDSCLNGLDAEDYLAAAEYDAVVLDIMLPGRDGLEVLRGLRAARDFESETQTAAMNRRLYPEAETLFMMTSPEYSCVSSTAVREIASFGGDISGLVPANILDMVNNGFDIYYGR